MVSIEDLSHASIVLHCAVMTRAKESEPDAVRCDCHWRRLCGVCHGVPPVRGPPDIGAPAGGRAGLPHFAHLPDDLKLGNNVGSPPMARITGATWRSSHRSKTGWLSRGARQPAVRAPSMGRCCTVAFRSYDNWASWGNTEWSYEQVLPYFRKMENDHDCGGEFHEDRPSPSTPLSAGRVDATGRGLSPGLC